MTADLTAATEAGRLAAGRLPSSGICKAHGRDANTCWDCSAIAAIEAAAPLIAAAARMQLVREIDAAADDDHAECLVPGLRAAARIGRGGGHRKEIS